MRKVRVEKGEKRRGRIKMFMLNSHKVSYGLLACNQCRGLGGATSPAQPAPVLCKAFVSISPEMWLSIHLLFLHNSILAPCCTLQSIQMLIPAEAQEHPGRRRVSLPLGWAWPCPSYLSQPLAWVHTNCGSTATALLRFQELQGGRLVVMSFPKKDSIQTD